MVIITSINAKGGVGKTTTVVGLSLTAAQLGFRVLAIDLDEQANLTQSFLGASIRIPSTTIADPIDLYLSKSDDFDAFVQKPRENVHLLPGSPSIATLDRQIDAPFLLAEAFDRWPLDRYDAVFIDTPGAISSSRLSMALCASTAYYIPIDLKPYSLDALPPTLALCASKRSKRYNPELVFLGFVPCMVDQIAHTGDHAGFPVKQDQKKVFQSLVEMFGADQCLGLIGRREPLARAFSKGVLIESLTPKSESTRSALDEFNEFAARVFQRARLIRVLDSKKGSES